MAVKGLRPHGGFKHFVVMAAAFHLLEKNGWSVAPEYEVDIVVKEEGEVVERYPAEVDLWASRPQSKRVKQGELHKWEDPGREKVAVEVTNSTHPKDKKNLVRMSKQFNSFSDVMLDVTELDGLEGLEDWVAKELPVGR